jgi:DNA-binding transcriptional LysR family regulator
LSYGRDLVEKFTRRHPRASVHIEHHHPDRVYELVAEDRVDIGLISYAQSTRTVSAISWCEERMILVCSPGHRLARSKSIDLRDLDGTVIVGFDAELKVRRKLDRELAERGVELRVEMAFDNIDTIKRAIEVNAGVSILPESTVRGELRSRTLVNVPVVGLDLVRPLGIIHRRGVELGKTARRFVQLLRDTSSTDDSSATTAMAEGGDQAKG